MPERNYYEVLGISRAAGADEIHAGYLERMHSVHPDLNSADGEAAHERAVEVVAAYGVLSDPSSRKRYDFRARHPFRRDGDLPGLRLLRGRDAEEAEQRFAEGLRRVTEDELARAVEPFKAALRLKPDYPAASYNLGLVGALLGNGSFALDVLAEGLRLSPKDDSLRQLRQSVVSTFMSV